MRCLPSTDGVELAVHDLGGEGPPLLLVHATGFCASVLGPLAEPLGGAYQCWGVDLRGHGLTSTPSGLDFAWWGFAQDVLATVDGLDLERPVGVGHSAGGAALLLAEAERPGTFSRLWCYEPIVWADLARARSRAERLADGARRRRDRFGSRKEARANYASKPPFDRLHPDALNAYVASGFAARGRQSVVLRCRPEVEAAIYLKAVEGDRFARLPEVICPTVVACGSETDAIDAGRARALAAAMPHGTTEIFEGLSHFGPLEDPPRVARAILRDLLFPPAV